jgi:hypothetical protein
MIKDKGAAMNFKIMVRALIFTGIVFGLFLPSGVGGCGGKGGDGPTVVVGDINGDGMADIIAGTGSWNDGTGRVYLFYGATISSRGAANADAIISGEAVGDNLWGYHSEDVNDDGYYDLIAVSWRWTIDVPRQIFIFYGAEGETPISGSLSATDADVIFTGATVDDGLKIFPGYVADVSGDGNSDIVFYARGADGDVGHFYVFFGPNYESKNASEADVVVAGEQIDGRFGVGLMLGDLNGDKIKDIVVSSTRRDGDRGRVYIFYGGSSLTSGTETDADVVIDGQDHDNRLQSVTAGDLNGDGVDDLVCASDEFNEGRGRAYVFYGGNLSNMGAGSADVIIDGENPEDYFPGEVHVMDVTGDGMNDLIMSTDRYDERTGRIYGFLGGTSLSSRSASNADFIFTGENQGDRLDTIDTEDNFFDANGDGIKDIIAYSRGYKGGLRRGRGYVFFGGDSLSSRNAADADVIITGENDNDDFNFYYGLDVNGDGIIDLIGDASEFSEIELDAGRLYLFNGGSDLTSMSAADAPVKIDGEDPEDMFGS